MILGSSRRAQIAQGLGVDGEITGIGAEFRSHVGDDGTLAGGKRGNAWAAEFDEFVREIDLPQTLRHRQRKVGCKYALTQAAGHANADDIRYAHHHGHSEDDAFSLETPDTPCEHTDAVDHRRVAVCSY